MWISLMNLMTLIALATVVGLSYLAIRAWQADQVSVKELQMRAKKSNIEFHDE